MVKYKNTRIAALMLLLSALSLTCFLTPPAPGMEEMTARAWENLRFIAEKPRPNGSVHWKETADFIVGKLQGAGLSPQILTLDVADGEGNPAVIRNIYAEIPGRTDKSVLFMAHYDSAPLSPGAGDNGMAVAALLETVAAFNTNQAAPNTGIKILFTDGEEVGLIGARAFVGNHTDLLENVLFVVNVEGFGGGPLMLIEGNRLADVYFGAVSKPNGFSAISALPGAGLIFDTRPFFAAGVPGMTIANVTGASRYHSPGDNLENASRQSMAQYMEALDGLFLQISRADDLSMEKRPPETTYFMLAYGVMVSFGAVARGVIAALTLAAVAALGIRQRKEGAFGAKRFILSLAGMALFVPLFVLLGQGLYRLAAILTWNRFVQIPFSRTGIIVLGVCVIAAVIPLALFYLKKLRRFASGSLPLSAAVFFSAAGAAASFIAPGLAYLPLFSAALIALRAVSGANKAVAALTLLAAGVLFMPLLYLAITAAGAGIVTSALCAVFVLVYAVLCQDDKERSII